MSGVVATPDPADFASDEIGVKHVHDAIEEVPDAG